MTPAQITELEAIWQQELETRAGPWEAALALVQHVQRRRSRRKAPTISIEEVKKIAHETYAQVAPSNIAIGSEYRAGALDLRDEILARLKKIR
jgi:hypothetical protein